MTSPSLRPDGIDFADEAQTNEAIRSVRRLNEPGMITSITRDRQVQIAQDSIATFEATGLLRQPNHRADHLFVTRALQQVAYCENESLIANGVAEWCMNQWLLLLQMNAEELSALRGLGQAWLARSQSVLSRIHRLEGSSSSGSSGRPRSHSDRLSYTSSEEARDAERANAEADARAHTADYVEARGMLIPAVDSFTRAIEVAERQGELTGDLLAEAAEANMSLGNVSYSHRNEQFFQRAVRYLRQAAQIPEFRLTPYLQSYLNDYGRLID